MTIKLLIVLLSTILHLGCYPTYLFKRNISREKMFLIKRSANIINNNQDKLITYLSLSGKTQLLSEYNNIKSLSKINSLFANFTIEDQDTLRKLFKEDIVKAIEFNSVNKITFLTNSSKLSFLFNYGWDNLYVIYCNQCDTTIISQDKRFNHVKKVQKIEDKFYKEIRRGNLYVGP